MQEKIWDNRKKVSLLSQNISCFKNKVILLCSVFITGTLLGLLFWDKINLPYYNPQNIISLVTLAHKNPYNTLLRFLVFIAVPSVLLVVAYLITFKEGYLWRTTARESIVNSDFLIIKSSFVKKLILFTFLLLFVFLGSFIIIYPYTQSEMELYHEGVILASEISYSSKQLLPYKDYFLYYGVLYQPITAKVSYKIFGKSIGAYRSMSSIYRLILQLILLMLFCVIFEGNYVLISLSTFGLFALHTSNVIFSLPKDHLDGIITKNYIYIIPRDIPVFAFLLILFLLFYNLRSRAIKSAASNELLPLFYNCLAAFIPIFSLSYSYDRAIYLLVSYAMFYPLLYFRYIRGNKYELQFILTAIGGLLSGFILFGYLIKWQILYFIKIIPLFSKVLFPAQSLFYPILQHKDASQGILPYVIILISANTFWLALKILQMFKVMHGDIVEFIKSFIDKYFIESSLLAVSIITFYSALGRSDVWHIMFCTSLTFIFSFYVLSKHYIYPLLKQYGFERSIWRFVLLTMSLTSFIWVLHINENKALKLSRIFPYKTPDIELIPQRHLPVINYLNENLKPGDEFFTFTNELAWYYFINKPCPVYYGDLRFMSATFLQEKCVRELEKKNVKYILYRDGGWWENIDGISNVSFITVVGKYIKDNYLPCVTINGHEILINKKYKIEASLESMEEYAKAQAFMSLKKYDKAAGYFEKVLGNNPDNFDAHLYLAGCYAKLGNDKLAEQHKSLFYGALFNKALNLHKGGRLDEAVGLYKTFLEKNPNDHQANFAIAYAFVDLKKYKEAITYFNKTLALKPDYHEVHYYLSVCYKGLGDKKTSDTELAFFKKLTHQ